MVDSVTRPPFVVRIVVLGWVVLKWWAGERRGEVEDSVQQTGDVSRWVGDFGSRCIWDRNVDNYVWRGGRKGEMKVELTDQKSSRGRHDW
jgi:hypothetical protein